MSALGLLLILGIIVLLVSSITRAHKPFYPLSRTGKPFDEYDEDGFLTHESYQSHIKHYPNGAVEVDLEALRKTRTFAEQMDACRQLSKQLGLKPYDGLD